MPNLTALTLLFLVTLAQSCSVNETYAYYVKAVLENKDNTQEKTEYVSNIAKWSNLDNSYLFDDYFENNEGYITTSSFFLKFNVKGFTWKLAFVIYDGFYIDKNVAYINFVNMNFPYSITFTDETNGTIFFSDVGLTTVYNDDSGPHISSLIGNLSLFLVEKSTLKPPKAIDKDHLSKYTYQFMFMDHSSSFSFTTPFFYETYPVSTLNKLIIVLGAVFYLILGLCSRYKPSRRSDISIGALACLYLYPFYLLSFLLVWFTRQEFSWAVMTWFIPFAIAIFCDILKNTLSIFNHPQFTSNYRFGIVLAFILSFTFALVPLVGFIIPSLFLLPQVLHKFQEKRQNVWYKSLTMFEVGHWTCMSLWILYVKLYPGNIFLLSPQPLIVGIFFGIIFIQLLMIAYVKFFIPGKQIFKYTFIEEDPTRINQLLLDQCSICLNNLKTEEGNENGDKLYRTPCGHTFHSECLLEWSEKKLVCPYCRKNLPDLVYPIN